MYKIVQDSSRSYSIIVRTRKPSRIVLLLSSIYKPKHIRRIIMSLIGDTQTVAVQPVVSSVQAIPMVLQAAVVDKNNAVNITLYSGKKEAACYLMKETVGGKLVMIIAGGRLPTSPWYRQDNATTGTITPA
jgi:hypothetical protein